MQGPQHAAQARTHLITADSLNPASAAITSDLALATYYIGRVDVRDRTGARLAVRDPRPPPPPASPPPPVDGRRGDSRRGR
jgi:hypothetical protein